MFTWKMTRGGGIGRVERECLGSLDLNVRHCFLPFALCVCMCVCVSGGVWDHVGRGLEGSAKPRASREQRLQPGEGRDLPPAGVCL